MKNIFLKILPLIILFVWGCSSNSTNPTNVTTTAPSIVSLSAEKTKILYGGQDPAYLTCVANGGNLKYTWEVDLGDIIPMNSDHSKVSFNGAACCVGDKIIKCTVSNDKGSDSKTIVITILENITNPEIISIESDKSEINAGKSETANITCYAIGGNLKYSWVADCGDIAFTGNDSSKVSYTAKASCLGTKNIKCTVSNQKGNDSKTYQISVVNK